MSGISIYRVLRFQQYQLSKKRVNRNFSQLHRDAIDDKTDAEQITEITNEVNVLEETVKASLEVITRSRP